MNLMKIKHFSANGVHGYLNFDITFNDDITFLIGINGSGKTSVLRLIQGLLNPFGPLLYQQTFQTAVLECENGKEKLIITAKTNKEYIEFKLNCINEVLNLPIPFKADLYHDKEIFKERLRRTIEEYRTSKTIEKLFSVSSLLFLGLERRISEGVDEVDSYERHLLQKRNQLSHATGTLSISLREVQRLVIDFIRKLRTKQEQYGEELRKLIILSAFKYEPLQLGKDPINKSPTIADYQALQRRRNDIIQAAEGLGVKPQELDERLRPFFSKMENVARKLATNDTKKGKKELLQNELVEWFINRPQVERFDTLIKLVEDYNTKVNELFSPIDRFKSSINLFLNDSGKKLNVLPDGELLIEMEGLPDDTIQALSSGERQILVMFAHLALSQGDKGSGVFIIDEPELSLHLRWQELFVETVSNVAPELQVILATHSPSIVLDRERKCVDLSRKGNIK